MDRRGFLKKIAGLTAAIVAFVPLYKYLSPDVSAEDVLIKTPADKVPEGGALIFQDRQLAILKKDGVITAMSLECTHLGCTVSLSGDTFACPCHGSVFALNGDVIKGPAVKSLRQYEFTQTEGELTVLRREKA
jgi:Rieske Fe-S protein